MRGSRATIRVEYVLIQAQYQCEPVSHIPFEAYCPHPIPVTLSCFRAEKEDVGADAVLAGLNGPSPDHLMQEKKKGTRGEQ